jgi:hypothetical protein
MNPLITLLLEQLGKGDPRSQQVPLRERENIIIYRRIDFKPWLVGMPAGSVKCRKHAGHVIGVGENTNPARMG